jgi:hypothetical protein
MFDEYSRREIAVIACWILLVCAASAWGSIYVIKNYVIGVRDDPIARAGGLKAEQIDLLPNLPSFISRVCSGFGPYWGGLQTRSV